jgi:hypothetical protein
VPNDTPISDNRAERVLAFMVASAVGLSIICFILIIVGSGAGWDFSQSPLSVIFVLPAIGLPLGLLLIIALIIVSGIRRGREAKDAGN